VPGGGTDLDRAADAIEGDLVLGELGTGPDRELVQAATSTTPASR
jgi:hypothetical protein